MGIIAEIKGKILRKPRIKPCHLKSWLLSSFSDIITHRQALRVADGTRT